MKSKMPQIYGLVKYNDCELNINNHLNRYMMSLKMYGIEFNTPPFETNKK